MSQQSLQRLAEADFSQQCQADNQQRDGQEDEEGHFRGSFGNRDN